MQLYRIFKVDHMNAAKKEKKKLLYIKVISLRKCKSYYSKASMKTSSTVYITYWKHSYKLISSVTDHFLPIKCTIISFLWYSWRNTLPALSRKNMRETQTERHISQNKLPELFKNVKIIKDKDWKLLQEAWDITSKYKK